MGTTPRGIPYPDDLNLIEDLELDFRALAEGADSAIGAALTAIFGALRPRILYGQRILTISSAASGSVAVTFATPFTVTPVVLGGCVTTTSTWIGAASGSSTTGCTLNGFHRDGSTGSATLALNFIAIGV